MGGLLLEHESKFSHDVRERLPRAASISKRLRRERELAFHGDIDFIPTEEYSAADSERTDEEAAWVVALAGEGHRAPRDVAGTGHSLGGRGLWPTAHPSPSASTQSAKTRSTGIGVRRALLRPPSTAPRSANTECRYR